ncbi:MAG: efflux RND transporter permease subunit [Chloroherpetonaceae bacterium]|nr:efflux RND transporter permease subunit [Chloroherpetonaceae bacterium]
MHHFLKSLLHRPVALSMVGFLILGLAIFFAIRLPISTAPEAEFPRLSIRTSWSGASPELMAEQVTAPIEEVASSVRGVKKVNSTTREGSSVVQLEFEKSIDQNLIKIELMEQLEALWQKLPAGVSRPALEKFVPKEFRDLQGFLVYQFYPKSNLSTSPALIKETIDQLLIPALSPIDGIGEMTLFGAAEELIEIELDEALMKSFGVSISDVENALYASSDKKTYGTIIENKHTLSLRSHQEFRNLRELEQLVIKSTSDTSKERISRAILLGSFAKIKIKMPEQNNFFRINGKSAVTLYINREATSNSLKLADKIQVTLDRILNSELTDLNYIKALDRTEPLRRELSHLRVDFFLALILLSLVLFLFLRNLHFTFIVLLNIAFSIAASVLVLSALGFSLNLITIAGMILVFGILTDNAVVVMDNIERKLTLDRNRDAIIAAASIEVFLPVLASTLTTIGALLPVLFLPDEIRLYFIEFVTSISVSLLSSLLISFTLIPTLVYQFAKDRQIHHSLPYNFKFDIYKLVLIYILNRPKRFITLTALLIGFPIYLLPEKIGDDRSINPTLFEKSYNSTLGSDPFLTVKPFLNYVLGGSSYLFYHYVSRAEFFGFGEETFLTVDITAPQGTSPERLNEIARCFEIPLSEYSTGISNFTTEINTTESTITVSFSKDAPANFPYILKGHLTAIAARVGGANVGVYGFGPGFYSGGNETSTYRVKITGYNYEELKQLSQKFKGELEKNPRIDNCKIDKAYGFYEVGKELALSINREKLFHENISLTNLFQNIRKKSDDVFSYQMVHLNGRIFPAELTLSQAPRFSAKDFLNQSYVDNEKQSRFADYLSIKKQSVLSHILRENQQNLRWITFDYKGRYDYGQRHLEAVASRFPFPPGYTINLKQEGFFLFSERNYMDFIFAVLLSLFIVFIVSAALYESFSKPFLIILAAPMALIGVFLSFYFFDANFGRGGYISLLLLGGITVNNSIILIDRLIKNTQSLHPSRWIDAIVQATYERTRPILITSFLTITSLIPILIRAEESSVWYGLTIGTIGGMISSTLLVLTILPAIFLLFSRKSKV